jgi:hypothetical protein
MNGRLLGRGPRRRGGEAIRGRRRGARAALRSPRRGPPPSRRSRLAGRITVPDPAARRRLDTLFMPAAWRGSPAARSLLRCAV